METRQSQKVAFNLMGDTPVRKKNRSHKLILDMLAIKPMTTATLADRLIRTPESIRMLLRELRFENLVHISGYEIQPYHKVAIFALGPGSDAGIPVKRKVVKENKFVPQFNSTVKVKCYEIWGLA
jgi:hypothetical protein